MEPDAGFCGKGHDLAVHGKFLFGRIRCLLCRSMSTKKNVALGKTGWGHNWKKGVMHLETSRSKTDKQS
jgi:hypothetical protein